MLSDAVDHVFDMHGQNETNPGATGSEFAGGEMLVHDNTVLVRWHPALVVRGRPEHGAWLYHNCLACESEDACWEQLHFTGNVHVDQSPAGPAPNLYSQSPDECETVHWCYNPGATDPQHYLAASSTPRESLRLGDFDGDGRTDVVLSDGASWLISSGGTGTWEVLQASPEPLEDVAIGDFEGDGHADVFRATGTVWEVSSGGATPFTVLNSASQTMSELLLGDFDGDRVTDVFITQGGNSIDF